MEDKVQFIKRWAVLSKTAATPQSAYMGSEKYVFLEGYPMYAQDFHLLSMKAIFGATTKLKVDQWNELHKRMRELCTGLSLPLQEEREAYTVVQMLKEFYNINEEGFDNMFILAQVQKLEAIMRQTDHAEGA